NIESFWNGCYNLSYASNAAIVGLENATNFNVNDKNRLIGEVLFVRAFIHFYLNNIFGDIPYIITTNYILNSSVNKTTSHQIYDLLITDLEEAKLLLSNTSSSTFSLRPTNNAVKSLLARIHLYNENWEAAEMEASSVINS